MNENQETITAWAEETFGENHPAVIAARMSVEVAELVSGLSTVAHLRVEDIDPETLDALREEVADVNVMLSQVAEKLQVDIAAVTDYKMSINRKRTWGRTASGHFQHTEEVPPVPEGPDPELMGAIARGWCAPANAQKEMDPELALAIAEEVRPLLKGPESPDVPFEIGNAGTFRHPESGLHMKVGKFYVLSDAGAAFAETPFNSITDALEWATGEEGPGGSIHVPKYRGGSEGFDNVDAVNVFAASDLLAYYLTLGEEAREDAA